MTFSPDFIGIGARRCASSQLHKLLFRHPMVAKGENGAHFYSKNFEKGGKWLKDYLGASEDNRISVEFSVSYIYPKYYETAAERIEEAAPASKLFVLIRNPVERAYSDWRRSVKMSEISSNMSFVDACKENPDFIDRGRFHKLLMPYWKRFGKDAIKYFVYEDLVKDRRRYLDDVATFFGIDVAPLLAPVQGGTGHAHGAKNKALHALLMSSKNTARSTAKVLGVEGSWNKVTRSLQPLYQKALELNARELEMTDSERRFAYELLKDDMEAFQEAIGRRLPGWSADGM